MWKVKQQVEKQGEEERLVDVKHIRFTPPTTQRNGNGELVRKGFRLGFTSLKALVEFEGSTDPLTMPCEISLSRMWVSKQDGRKWESATKTVEDPKTGKPKTVRVAPDERFYFQRYKLIVKEAIVRRYYKEERTGKRCTTKVTQRVPIEEGMNGATRDEHGDWWVKHIGLQREFELNNAAGENHWGSAMAYVREQFGAAVEARVFTGMAERLEEIDSK